MKAAEIEQEFKELNIYLDAIYQQGVTGEKDAGHLWIAFTDKMNAFKRNLLASASTPTEALISSEDGTVTDHELQRIIGRFFTDNPKAGSSYSFAQGFRLGQQYPATPTAGGAGRKNKMEEFAKRIEDKVPNLAAALRSENLQNTLQDMDEYDGWVRCKTDLPPKGEQVLVTDGKEVWMGQIEHKERRGAMPFKEWSIVYDGAPPFKSTEVIAWMFKPTVLPDLFNK